MKLPADYNKLKSWQKKFVREQYAHDQKHLCYHCGVSLKEKPKQTKPINWKLFPDNFMNYPVHLHHDHVTGMTIGVVHAYCNAVLW